MILDNMLRGRTRTSCDYCSKSKLKCGGEKPQCNRCSHRNTICTYNRAERVNRLGPTAIMRGTMRDTDARNLSIGRFLLGYSQDMPSTSQVSSDMILNTSIAASTEEPLQLPADISADLDNSTGTMDNHHLDPNSELQAAVSESLDQGFAQSDIDEILDFQPLHNMIGQHSSPSGSWPFSSVAECMFNFQQSATDIETHLPTQSMDDVLEESYMQLFDEDEVHRRLDTMCNSQLGTATTNAMHHSQLSGTNKVEAASTSRCRCYILVTKLYYTVSHSQSGGIGQAVRLDLLLFIEKALREARSTVTDCANCQGSASAANTIVFYLVTAWLIEHLRGFIETKITEVSATKLQKNMQHRSWTADDEVLSHEEGEGRSPKITKYSTSTDNKVRLGSVTVADELRDVCIALVLKSCVKRLGQELGDGNSGGRPRPWNPLNEMAMLMVGKLRVGINSLIGMVELWISGLMSDWLATG